MSNQPNISPANLGITPPVYRDPDELVESVYPLPGTTDMPDLESQDIMAEYLMERFMPDSGPRIRIGTISTGRTMPGIHRVPDGIKEVTRLRKTGEWLISPRAAAIVMLGSAALFNTAGNPGTIGGAAQYAWHEIFDRPHDHTISTPGKLTRLDVTADTTNRAGIAKVDPGVVERFVRGVEDAEKSGGQVRQIRITGNTSDEWGTEASLGVKDPQNTLLGKARAKAAIEAMSADGLKLQASQLTVGEEEHILTAKEQASILKEARADGYPTVKAAIDAVDGGQPVKKSLAKTIRRFFSGKHNRGVSLSATVEHPGKATVRTVHGEDNPPDVPSPHWRWFIPLLPIRKRERYNTVKQVSRWEFTASRPIPRPTFIVENDEKVWLRLRPEALREDGSLVSDAWAYSRKYEHLLRDERIADILRADYLDGRGGEKSLRIMFVDESPAEETITAFGELLKKFAAMEEGKLGDRVSAIFVYPSENAGTDHDDPKRIAMGIDKQSHEGILGTYTYPLDLVELHMPSTWETEELLQAFEEFNGPRWVLAHEVAGHGTDENDRPQLLRQVHTPGIPNAYVFKGDPRAYKMRPLRKVLRKLPDWFTLGHKPIEFDIEYPVLDNDGQTVTMHARVEQGDPRLAHASTSIIVGHRPTRYAGTNDSEHYAETAASVTTAISVPYNEASVRVAQLRTDNGERAVFAEGYRPDKRGQQVFTSSVGAVGGSYPVSFREQPEVAISRIRPEDDPLVRRELARTHRVRTLYPAQMIAILARVVQRKG